MTLTTYRRRIALPVAAEAAFAWHARPGAFERLNPPFDPAAMLGRTGEGIENGTRVRLAVGPFRQLMEVEHRDLVPGRQFRDVMRRGPFAHWDHLHQFEPDAGGGSVLEDTIEYALPMGFPAAALGGGVVRRVLDRLFDYRHALTRDDLAMHARATARGVGPMRVLISGGSGLVGSALRPALTTGGHTVVTLTRRTPRGAGEARWDPAAGTLDRAALAGVDAVVHLAGASIGGARWNAAHKARIRESRVRGTRVLAEAIAALEHLPRVMVSASAIGLFGDRGDETLDEGSAPGSGFLAEVAQEWEAASAAAAARGVRVVTLRFGIVLTPSGGALEKLLPPFRLGAGGPLGSGRQWMSWIGIDDLVGALHHALTCDAVRGPVHATAPEPVRNADFARVLGRVLGRPALLPVPAFALRALLGGEMAEQLLLASARVMPARLLETGYRFRTPTLEAALRHVLGRQVRA